MVGHIETACFHHSGGHEMIFAANREAEWLRSTSDIRECYGKLFDKESGSSVIMLSPAKNGVMLTVSKMIPNRFGDNLTAYLYIPNALNVPGETLQGIVFDVISSLAHNRRDIVCSCLSSISKFEYEQLDQVEFEQRPTNSYAYRKVRNGTGVNSLSFVLNNLFQDYYLQYKYIFLAIDDQHIANPEQYKDLTDYPLKEWRPVQETDLKQALEADCRSNHKADVNNNGPETFIKCSECGYEVSDKALACPNCGCPVEKALVCSECGQQLPIGVDVCPNCGCPTEPVEISRQIAVETPQMSKVWIWVIAVLSSLLLLAGGAFVAYHYLFNNKSIVKLTPEFIEKIQKYDKVRSFSEGFAAVEQNGQLGFINTKGEEVIPCIYDEVYNFSEGLVKVRQGGDEWGSGGKWGVINTKGAVVVPCIYDEVGDFSEELVKVRQGGDEWGSGGKWGVINTKGAVVVPCIYDEVMSFSEGFAAVEKNDKWGFINTKGAEIIPFIYDRAWGFSEGFAAVEKNGKWGVINTKGEVVVPCIYDFVIGFSEGLARVVKNDKMGFINTKGAEIVPCIYVAPGADLLFSFSEGLTQVVKDDKWGFINTRGEEVIPCIYDGAGYFSEGLAQVEKNGKCGFINTKGEEVIPFKYDPLPLWFYWFKFSSEGLAQVCKKDKVGLINTRGEVVVPCIYDRVDDFSEGLARVEKNDKWGFINTKGEEVIPCIYDEAGDFSEGVAVVQFGDKYGYVDATGKDTFTPYDWALAQGEE